MSDHPHSPIEAPPESNWDSTRDPLEELASEYVERLRQGQQPRVEEYTSKYPELADEIVDVFPTVAAMEGLQRRVHRSAPLEDCPVEQLGDFKVVAEIGRGGMGIVYEAEQVTLGRRVAVKVLPKHALRGPRDVQRFHREAQTAAKLHHTNIVPVFGVGEQDGIHYIVMQFIKGVGLDEILAELRHIMLHAPISNADASTDSARSRFANRNAAALLSGKLSCETIAQSLSDTGRELRASSDGDSRPAQSPSTTRTAPPSGTGISGTDAKRNDIPAAEPAETATRRIHGEYWKNVARIGLQAAKALQYAHANGTLHRDVKPDNLLLDEQGVVWMVDFGLAKAVEHSDVTWTGDVVGTLSYMAPERFRGEADARSDIYGLGLTLYELLTFRRAFEGKDRVALMHRVTKDELAPPRRHNPSIPRDLETIVMKAAAKESGDRYESAEALAADLECYLEDRPIRARRARPTEQLVRWCRRNPVVAGLTVTAACSLILAVVGISVGYVREAAHRQQAEIQRQRAESTSRAAVQTLERIYAQFAPEPVNFQDQAPSDENGEAAPLTVQSQLPLSPNVAHLLESLLAFYDQLSLQSEGKADVLLKSVVANRRVGDIHHRLGESDKALAAYQRGIQRLCAVRHAVSEESVVDLELARIHNGRGIVLAERRQNEEAVTAHREALQLLEANAVSAPYQFELARSLYLLYLNERRCHWRKGHKDGEEDKPESLESYLNRATSLLSSLVKRYPYTPDYGFLLARCYRATSERSWDESPSAGFQQAIAILEKLLREFPDSPDYRFELGDLYNSMVLRKLYRRGWRRTDWTPDLLREAEDLLLSALDVTKDLELSHPNIPQYLMLKTRLHDTYGKVLEEAGRIVDAERQYRRAVEKQRLVVRHARDGHHHEIFLAKYRLRLAEAQLQLGQADDAYATLMTLSSELEALLDDPASQLGGRHHRDAEELLAESDDLLRQVRER